MGIRGLETYIENHCPEALEVVDIKKLADDYKKKKNKDPVIVMDVASCIRPIYAMFNIDWLFGGEFKQWEEALKKFIKSFADLGIKFVVVFDGTMPDAKHKTWCRRQVQHLRKVSDVFYLLNQNLSDRISYERHFQLPPCVWSVAEAVFLSNENCTCWHSVREADEEIAEYSVRNDCFAILAWDSDFIIYTGAQNYLSMKHLNLGNMTTRNYKGDVLARRLRMNFSQLPLFATLVGNDTVQFDDVKYFHNDLCPRWRVGRIPFNDLYQELAQYVQSKPYGLDVLNVLNVISLEVFHTDAFVPMLRDSLENYWIDRDSYYLYVIPYTGHPKWDLILKNAYERHVSNKSMPQVYNILIGEAVRIGPPFEDFLSIDILPSSLALLAMRKRQYGILFKEKPCKDYYVTEWLAIGENSLESPFQITPWYIDHPGLLKLWDEKDKSLNEVRWKTFCKAVSFKLNYKKVMSLPKILILPFLAIFFMQNEIGYKRFWDVERSPLMHPFEIEAFVSQFVFVSRSSAREIEIKLEEFENRGGNINCLPRAVHLVTLFQKTICQLQAVSSCCGTLIYKEDTSIANFFSGKIFHAVYKFFKEGLNSNILIRPGEDQILYDKLMKMVVDA